MNVRIYKDLEQGSESWLAARCGILTASVIGKLITPSTLKVADNETSRGLTYTLAAERITGHVDYVHPTFDMQRGSADEPYARQYYAEHFAPVDEIGFAVIEEGAIKIGYSPDGLVGDEGLIEIKSRKPKEQINTVLSGRPPAYNMAQMQTGMYVMDRKWCDYVSFSAGLPLWVHRVHRDIKWFEAIWKAAEAFEVNVTNIVNNFNTATDGLPMTERRPDLENLEFSF